MADMRLIVAGAGGRMGRALTRVISETEGAVVTGALEAPGSELIGQGCRRAGGTARNGVPLSGDLWSLSKMPTAFSISPCRPRPSPMSRSPPSAASFMSIGTTGLSASEWRVIKSVTSRAIIVQSGNISLGVNLLAALVKRVAQSLDESFDIEILEMHHKAKMDAPSGPR